MKTPTTMVVLAFVACLSTAALADDHEAVYVDGSYYVCSGGLDRVDELIETVVKPIYDTAVEAGDIKGWGWLSHHTGGSWTRVLYHTGGSVTGVNQCAGRAHRQGHERSRGRRRGVRQGLYHT